MKFTVVTILPELIEPSLTAGVVGRAREAGVITVRTINPRDFTHDKHRTVDDTPYGGGPGMVMKAEPLLAAIERAGSDVPPPSSAPRAASEDGLPGDPEDILSTGRFDRASLRELSEAEESDIMTTGRFTRPSLSDFAKAAREKSGAANEREAARRARAAREGTPTDAHGDALDDAAAQRALAQLERDHADHEAEPVTDPRTPALDDPAARALAELEGKPVENEGDVLDDESAARALEQLERQARERDAGLRHAEIKRDEVKGSLSSVDASIGKLEGALGGNLDALAPNGMSPSSTSPSSPSPAGGASTAAGATSAAASATSTTPSSHKPHRILLSPSGKPLTQARVRELAKLDHLVLVCGRYEGIDQRVIDLAIDEELSIGDYVLSGGELGALVIIDAVARYVPGVLGEATSVDDESFSAGLLEYPQYTKPADLRGKAVPPVLLSGNHALVAAWRRDQAMRRTAARRPDLYRSFQPTKADAKSFPPLRARTHLALVHHPVVDRTGAVVTTALTNFDIHDLARSSMTFGLAGYHIVTPITSQREKAQHIAELWIGDEQGEHRARALRLVRTADTIDAVIQAITEQHGLAPRVVATSAKPTSFPAAIRQTSTELLAESTLDPAPLLILLGTGWGLADHLIPSVSRILAPIEGASDWNHLSVRSAGAVILDRLFGRPA